METAAPQDDCVPEWVSGPVSGFKQTSNEESLLLSSGYWWMWNDLSVMIVSEEQHRSADSKRLSDHLWNYSTVWITTAETINQRKSISFLVGLSLTDGYRFSAFPLNDLNDFSVFECFCNNNNNNNEKKKKMSRVVSQQITSQRLEQCELDWTSSLSSIKNQFRFWWDTRESTDRSLNQNCYVMIWTLPPSWTLFWAASRTFISLHTIN